MPESWVRDPLGELVRTRVGGVTLGRNWLEKIQLDWPNIFTVEKAEVASNPAVKAELRQHTEVFSDKPSAINDFKATIRVLMQH